MKSVSNNFKTDIKTFGRQFDYKFKINNSTIDNDNINSIKPSFNASMFKTIMHKVEIDSKNSIPKGSRIDLEVGVKVNEASYEYISYNPYVTIKESERQEDTLSYITTAYDKMIEAMIEYDLTITEKITVREYLIAICQRLNWNTSHIPNSFINSSKLVNPVLHQEIGYTFRDALDEIATITCSYLLFKGEDFYLLYPEVTNETIDESYLDEDNIAIGERYFINSLVFSRVEDSDSIYRKDNESIQSNGLHEYKISDNQLLSTNDRDLYIDEMFNYLKTLNFFVFDVESKGILFLEAVDMFSFYLNGETYNAILLNDDISFDDGLKESIYTDKPEETETDYKYSDETDKRINQTYLMVDKQNQIIESFVSNTAETTTTGKSYLARVVLEKINKSEPIRIEIRPLDTSISYLYPRNNLYPSDNLFMPDRIVRFANTTTNENFDYELPDDLLYFDEETYDEFKLDYENQICQVTKRVGYNADGTIYKLNNEVTTQYTYPKIEITSGDYEITIPGYSDAYLFVKLMKQNIYTDQFATKVEVSSEISQTSQEIDASVNSKLTNYSTTTEMNSAIQIKANEITSSVIQTYETKSNAQNSYATKNELSTAKSEIKQTTDSISSTVSRKVGNDEIISKINQSAESVTINSNKLSLNRENYRFNK